MDDHRNRNTTEKDQSKQSAIYSLYIKDDPVYRKSLKDKAGEDGLKKQKEKTEEEEEKISPTMSTRIGLGKTESAPIGVKYKPPRLKNFKKITEEKRRQLEKDRKFCKFDVTTMPTLIEEQKIDKKIERPSAEIKEAQFIPRKASITPSETFPERPSRKVLLDHQPKSGTIINRKPKRLVKKKQKPPEPTAKEPAIEELIARELATIKEMAGSEEEEEEGLPFEGYLTKRFRKKVAQLSKTTSVHSQDLQKKEDKGKQQGEEEEDEEPAKEEEEERFVTSLAQKFRRDSEIKRYQRPKRKTKKGTLENFSFTRLKQPTLKSFYYGIKMATIHQGDDNFPAVSRNRQGICMPIAAYCLSILKHPDRWTQADIDDILEAGNDLFLKCIGSEHMHGDDVEVKTHNLQKYCKIGKKKIRFAVSDPEISGMVRSDDRKIYNLTKAINVFFGRFTAGILQTDSLSVALWKDKLFYFFDAKPRTLDLFSSPSGVAVMANFYDTTSVISVLLDRSNLENTPFVIYSIKAFKVLKWDAEEVESNEKIKESDNYQVLDEERAVAQGSFDLADKCFGFSRNKQALTVAVVALVYSKISPPTSWHRGTVDKIMIIGNQLFLECIEDDSIVEVDVDDLPAVFTIGPYVVEISIAPNRFVDFMTSKGKNKLLERLTKFFETSSNAVVQIDRSALAVWKQRNIYHCFDPYSRNKEGLKCRDGAACVSIHTTLNSLVKTVSANFDRKDTIFRVHAMKVCKIHRDPDRTDVFPKNLTMNDYPIDSFKKYRLKRGTRKASAKPPPVTVDPDTKATQGQLPDGSILEVGSNVRSIAGEDLPPMCRKEPPKILKELPPPSHDFVADLDSPSLSDTQIEPPLPEDPEGEVVISFQDFDDMTQEEKELAQRGEDEGSEKDEDDKDDKDDKKKKKKKKEDADDDDDEDEDEKEKEEKEENLAVDEAEDGGEQWYMATSHYTQVGSRSLLGTASAQINTDRIEIEVPVEDVPTAKRTVGPLPKALLPILDIAVKTVQSKDETDDLKNFIELPDGSQVVLGSMFMGHFFHDQELLAPFVCIMAAAVARKYAIDTWSTDIVDYVLRCGVELVLNANTRFDLNYSLEIPKISLGSTDLAVKVDYAYDGYLKSRVLSAALQKTLFRYSATIVVTPTYSCTVFQKERVYYLYDGFANNPLGLSMGANRYGFACLSRFQTLSHLVARIIHNKSKRERREDVEYNRFVLSSCQVHLLPKAESPDEEYEKEAAGGGEDDRFVPPPMVTYKKPVDKAPEKKKPPKMGYHETDGLYKIEGSWALGGANVIAEGLKEDYFGCLCACLFLMNTPLKKWDEDRVDSAMYQGVFLLSTTVKDKDVCSKKFIKNVQVDDYLFDVITSRVTFAMEKPRRTLKNGIQTMLQRKHRHFILQFPNRSYAISVDDDGVYNLFDPNDQSGKASWTRYSNFQQMVERIRSGVIAGSEIYNFHSFEIMSISNAPAHVVLGNRSKKYRVLKEKKKERKDTTGEMPFTEKFWWLEADPIPWSWKVDKDELPKWNNWSVDIPDDLYSLVGEMCVKYSDGRNSKEETLGHLVVAICMTRVYELCDWNENVMDAIVQNGLEHFSNCVADISDVNYEVTVADMDGKEVAVPPYAFVAKFTPVVEGTMFVNRPKQFNLYKALRFFFDEYECRFGIIFVTKKATDKHFYAFGKTQESEYFFYDCDTLGPPMFPDKDSGTPYVLRTTTFNRLLHVMVVVTRGGDFYIFDVTLSRPTLVI